MGLMGGVAAYPVMTDVYRIEARGNGYTNAARVQDFVLLKAAETTLAAGKTHFGLTSAADASRQGAIETPGTMQATRVGNTITGIYTPGSVSTFIKPGQDVYIRIYGGSKASVPADALDAADIERNIAPRLRQS